MTRTPAPLPSPEEQAIIDRFGIFGERTDKPYGFHVCQKRHTYDTRREATKALNLLLRQRAVQGQTKFELRYHWCRQHEGFHLTSKPWGGR